MSSQPSVWNDGWWPEQIAGGLKAGNEPGLRGPGTETIYRFISRARQKVEKLWKLLPRGNARRGRRKRRETETQIMDRRSIHERPEAVMGREKLGDWESDLIFCRRRTQPVLVLHERTSRLALPAKLAGKSAAEIAATLMAIFRRLTPELKNSIGSASKCRTPSRRTVVNGSSIVPGWRKSETLLSIVTVPSSEIRSG